jgi:hypothetical protein
MQDGVQDNANLPHPVDTFCSQSAINWLFITTLVVINNRFSIIH